IKQIVTGYKIKGDNFLKWREYGRKRSSTQALVVLEAELIKPVHVAAGGHRAAEPVVADVQTLHVGHLRREDAVDVVVADIEGAELLRQLHGGEVEAEGVAREVEDLERLVRAEQERRVACEGVVRQVEAPKPHGGELGRDAADEVVVREAQKGRVGGLAEEAWRDAAREAVAAEVEEGEVGEVGERRRDGARERAEGEPDVEPGQGARDGAVHAGDVDQEELLQRGEAGDGVAGEGPDQAVVAEERQGDDAARGVGVGRVVAEGADPLAAGEVGRPRLEVGRVAERRLHGQKRRPVTGVAFVLRPCRCRRGCGEEHGDDHDGEVPAHLDLWMVRELLALLVMEDNGDLDVWCICTRSQVAKFGTKQNGEIENCRKAPPHATMGTTLC
ncbi:hypothetical protein EJB05_35298, partial [Eragrostis curvula]